MVSEIFSNTGIRFFVRNTEVHLKGVHHLSLLFIDTVVFIKIQLTGVRW